MALSVTIGGQDCTDLALDGSLSIQDNLNNRNTCSLSLVMAVNDSRLIADTGASFVTDTGYGITTLPLSPAVSMDIVIQSGATKVFSGTIDSLTKTTPSENPNALIYALTCVDNNQIADRHIVAAVYTSETLSAIVLDIVANDLAGEGISTSGVQTGPTIDSAIFNYVSVAAAFNQLAAMTGYAWWIDANMVLNFCERSTIAAPFALTDTSANYRKLKQATKRDQYRNRQYIRAGTDLTPSRTESFSGDGTRKAFTLNYPAGAVPTSITVGGVSQTIGIQGVDTGKQWYWNLASSTISQDSGGAALTTAQTLAVTYQGQFPIIVQAQDDAEITAMINAEGGSGVYESVFDEPNVNSQTLALNDANALLRKYGNVPNQITFETDVDGLFAGQLIQIQNTLFGLSDSYLIDQVTVKDVNGQFLRYTVRALDGETLGSWSDYFKSLIASTQAFVVRANEVVTYLRTSTVAVTAADALTMPASAASVAATASISLVTSSFAPEDRVDYATADYSEVA